ncbi:NADP-dependent oxidoreductase [Frigoribacterium sp. Leaf164]|uniref:quinone oxidoreductase family protein n=1 Tax=Frigoribacterium sp. Leaf164 TaxID=1736282 RepID=UPI00138EF39C|nr:NADP-dependent oxidoreductase [Frigoribacterium sp. Leaf164]
MRAIGVRHYGGPEELMAVDLPEPHAGPGQVRIRVHAAAVNPVDAIIRSGSFQGNDGEITSAVVPGTDVSGVIDEVGSDLPESMTLLVGDEVVGFVAPSGSHGGYSEFVVLPAESLVALPTRGDHVSGAAFLSNALTAEMALEGLHLEPGSVLAVTGATGAVGGYLVELASARGVTVIADARPDEHAIVRAFGAHHVVDRDANFGAEVRKLTDGKGADALADPAARGAAAFEAVADGGQLALFLPADLEPRRGVRVFQSYVMRSNRRHDAIEALAGRVGRGELTVRVADTLPADQASTAHRRMEAGGLRGRLILTF